MFVAAIALGRIATEPPRPIEIPAPPPPPKLYRLKRFIPLAPPTPQSSDVAASETFVEPVATSTPDPYDDTDIPVDLDDVSGDDCTIATGCMHWVCHYEKDVFDGYHLMMGTRTTAAHLAQHPHDYVDDASYDDDAYEGCADVDDGE